MLVCSKFTPMNEAKAAPTPPSIPKPHTMSHTHTHYKAGRRQKQGGAGREQGSALVLYMQTESHTAAHLAQDWHPAVPQQCNLALAQVVCAHHAGMAGTSGVVAKGPVGLKALHPLTEVHLQDASGASASPGFTTPRIAVPAK